MLRIIFVLCYLVMFFSCDTIGKREELVDELSRQFHENFEEFEYVRDYLSKENSYFGFTFDYKDNRIKLKQGKNSVKFDSISQIKTDTVVYKILLFMKEGGIRDISGNKDWIKVTYEEQKYPCFSFWYRADFNPEDDKTKIKINNFKNRKSKNWIFVLNDNWFIKGEPCF